MPSITGTVEVKHDHLARLTTKSDSIHGDIRIDLEFA